MRRAVAVMALVSAVLLGCEATGNGAGKAAGGSEKIGPATTRAGAAVRPAYDSPGARLMRAGKFREARGVAEKELAAVRADAKASRQQKLDAMELLSGIDARLARYAEAEALCKESLGLLDENAEGDRLAVATVQSNLAELKYVTAQWDEALVLAKKALATRKKLLPEGDPDLAKTLATVAFMTTQSPHAKLTPAILMAAQADVVSAWKARTKAHGPESAEAADAWNTLGLFFMDSDAEDTEVFADGPDEDTRVLRCLNKALDIRRGISKEHPDVAESLVNRAYFQMSRERLDDAAKDATDGLAIIEKAFGAEHPDVAYTLNLLGQVRQQQGRLVEAEALFQRAQKVYEKNFGPSHYFVGVVVKNLAEFYEEMGDKTKAKGMVKKLDRIRGRDI